MPTFLDQGEPDERSYLAAQAAATHPELPTQTPRHLQLDPARLGRPAARWPNLQHLPVGRGVPARLLRPRRHVPHPRRPGPSRGQPADDPRRPPRLADGHGSRSQPAAAGRPVGAHPRRRGLLHRRLHPRLVAPRTHSPADSVLRVHEGDRPVPAPRRAGSAAEPPLGVFLRRHPRPASRHRRGSGRRRVPRPRDAHRRRAPLPGGLRPARRHRPVAGRDPANRIPGHQRLLAGRSFRQWQQQHNEQRRRRGPRHAQRSLRCIQPRPGHNNQP